MDNFTIFLLIAAFAIFWIATSSYRKKIKRDKVREQAFPAEWRTILRKNVPFFYKIPADLQLQLKDKMKVFLSEKQFVGRQGQDITDEVRVTIAAQACMLLLNRKLDFYPFLQTIVVYPAAFISGRTSSDESGVHYQDTRVILGESWTKGQVILSWRDSAAGASDIDDGHNLVMHEFAHQLDGENGATNGSPPLNSDQSQKEWSQVMQESFDRLQSKVRKGHSSIIDRYGATNSAEFFAVSTETFFEQPEELQQEYPELYQQLSNYYKVNPLIW